MKKILLFSILLLSSLLVNAQFTESKKPDSEKLITGLSYGWSIYEYTSYNPTKTTYCYIFQDMTYINLHLQYQLWFDSFDEFKNFVVALDRCIQDKELQLTNRETSTGYKYTLSHYNNMGTKNVEIYLYTPSGIKIGWIQKVDVNRLKEIVGI